MGQTLYYGNKSTNIPGVYTNFRSGVNNQPITASFGNVLIIDTGMGSKGYRGSGFSGGAGISGTLKSGIDSIQEFNTLTDFRNSVKGSEIWLLGEPLFFPQGSANPQGVPKILFAKAASTTPSEISYTFNGGGSDGGTFTIQTRDEGLSGNGFEYDQTYATSVVTVNTAGGTGDTHTITVSGVTIASYENEASDTIADVVNGLVASISSIGISSVAASDATTLTITAPNFLTGVNANSVTPAVVNTGTADTSAVQFSGGVDGTALTRGYAGVMRAGTLDSSKFAIDFYVGTFKGNDSEGDAWDFVTEALSEPQLLVSSAEFDNIADLNTWATNDSIFQNYFNIKTYTLAGTGAVTTADLTANAGNNLASGGTETYSTTHLDSVLDAIEESDYTFVLSLDGANNAQSADNSKIVSHLVNEAKYRKFMFVGGANDDTLEGSNSSSETAAFYDSERVIVVHSGCRMRRRGASGFKDRSSLYKAALVLGRISGNEPQVPVTFKQLAMDDDIHKLNKIEQTKAINNGVLATVYDNDFGSYIVLQGINSKQDNQFVISDDGSSFELSIESIKAQLAKEIEINAKLQLLGQSSGVNRNTLNPSDVVTWLETFLSTKEATDLDDNLIISSSNISVTVDGTIYRVNYAFVPNGPVNFLLFEGIILE